MPDRYIKTPAGKKQDALAKEAIWRLRVDRSNGSELDHVQVLYWIPPLNDRVSASCLAGYHRSYLENAEGALLGQSHSGQWRQDSHIRAQAFLFGV